jgi:putative addiction module component (TIGR02574 family)
MKELAGLSSAERILLAQELWDSAADDADAWELTPEQSRELQRRVTAFESRRAKGERSGSSWAQVKRRLRRKFPRKK